LASAPSWTLRQRLVTNEPAGLWVKFRFAIPAKFTPAASDETVRHAYRPSVP
jgi:hypothetical protein